MFQTINQSWWSWTTVDMAPLWPSCFFSTRSPPDLRRVESSSWSCSPLRHILCPLLSLGSQGSPTVPPGDLGTVVSCEGSRQKTRPLNCYMVLPAKAYHLTHFGKSWHEIIMQHLQSKPHPNWVSFSHWSAILKSRFCNKNQIFTTSLYRWRLGTSSGGK